MKESISFVTPLMDGIFVVFQHKVKPGSYVWKHHRPPPRRPNPRRPNVLENVFEMDAFRDMFEHLEEMESYSPEDLDSEDTSPWEMGLLFSLMGFDTSDSSSDDEFIF